MDLRIAAHICYTEYVQQCTHAYGHTTNPMNYCEPIQMLFEHYERNGKRQVFVALASRKMPLGTNALLFLCVREVLKNVILAAMTM